MNSGAIATRSRIHKHYIKKEKTRAVKSLVFLCLFAINLCFVIVFACIIPLFALTTP